ncbi:unnamed protein product [Lactuca virosa]|uniref:Uncharacterized protein n=1 Tax=Lactuca virosa TaxID=75947 RepID=A0AAU9PWM5_9ASTR|nr:unnamed protein product [Lactuca virosa]
MGFKEFIIQLQKLDGDMCNDVYYYVGNWAMLDGLGEVRDDNDYVRFIDIRYDNDCKIYVYLDEYQELIKEWINEEKVEEGGTKSDTCEDDVDSIMLDDISLYHEVDDECISLKKYVDLFLAQTNVIPLGGVNDKNNGHKNEVHFDVYDPNR